MQQEYITKEYLKQTLSEHLDDFAKIVKAGFDEVHRKFHGVDKRFDAVDRRFEEINRKFDNIDQRFEEVNKRFDKVYGKFEQVNNRLGRLEHGVQAISLKLDYKADKFGLDMLKRQVDKHIEAHN
jgi:predicted nuclease with TOPRIM domain